MKVRVAIIGAGPAGLTLANALLEHGCEDFVVLEKEPEAGGLCRSRVVDGAPLDIGGGHFLDVRRPEVTEFLFRFMPRDDWNLFRRDSRIAIFGRMIGSPFEANIWQLDEQDQRRYLADIAAAGCNTGEKCPTRFVDWIYWKLGKGIADDYMLPYNRKMFGDDLNRLGTYWLEKLPSVSYEDTLRSCREHRACAQQPGHAQFYYPKHSGYGEVWRRMGETLGGRLLLNHGIQSLDVQRRIVNENVCADIVVNTAPWTAIPQLIGITDAARETVSMLRHTAIDVDYIPDRIDTEAQWIYQPASELPEHRWLVRGNFCPNAAGYWKETRVQRNSPIVPGRFRHTSEYAYPLNTIGKNERMTAFLAELSRRNVIGLGRWGEWQHYNSDLVVEKALSFARKLCA